MDNPEDRFEEFRDLVLSNESMQSDLHALTDMRQFVSRVVELGKASGFEFTEADIEQKIRSGRRSWAESAI